MNNFHEISEAPPAWVLPANVLSPERLDASYYEPRYLRAAAQLEALPCDIANFRQICTKLNCGATPELVEYGDKGVPLIRTSNVRPNLYDSTETLRVPGFAVDEDSNVAILPEDVLYTMSGSVGYAAVYPEDGEIASCSNTIARGRIEHSTAADPYYVAAFLNSSLGKLQSDRLVSGGVLGHVMPNSVKKIRIALPSASVQRAVGNRLRKAERLRRFCGWYWSGAFATFEQASGISLKIESFESIHSQDISNKGFRCVTVDPPVGWANPSDSIAAQYFHPRRIHAQQIASNRLHWDSLGRLAISHRKKDRMTTPARCVGLDQIDSALGVLSADGTGADQEQPSGIIYRKGHILFSRLRPYLNKVAIWPEHWSIGTGSGELLVYEAGDKIDSYYLFFILKSPLGLYQIVDVTAGSTLPRVDSDVIEEIRIPRLSSDAEARIAELVREAHRAWYESQELIPMAKANVEAIIAGNLNESALLLEGEEIQEWLRQNIGPSTKQRT